MTALLASSWRDFRADESAPQHRSCRTSPPRPDAPGQFAFANGHRVYTILEESGWGEIDIRPIDVVCTLPEKELVRYLTRLGPVGLIFQEADDRTGARVIETVRAAFDPYVHGTESALPLPAGWSALRLVCFSRGRR